MKSSRLREKKLLPGMVKLKKAIEASKTEKSNDEFDIETIISAVVEKFPEPIKSKLIDAVSSWGVNIYEYLTKELENLFEPRQYIETLWKLFEIAENNKARPFAMKEYWISLNLDNKQLNLLLRHFIIALTEIEKQTKSFVICKSFVETEFKKLNDEHKIPLIKESIEKKNETFFDIWLPDRYGNKDQYKKFIDYLKRENSKIASSFVIEINDKLYWNKVPQSGWQQYMAAFVYTCIKKQWILAQHSAPTFVKVLNNTFNAKANSKWFKAISTNPPKEIYLEPFSSLASNI